MNQSVKLAKLWTTLNQIKDQLDNVAVPLGNHLSLDDSELMAAMEELSDKIEVHFQRFILVIEIHSTEQG